MGQLADHQVRAVYVCVCRGGGGEGDYQVSDYNTCSSLAMDVSLVCCETEDVGASAANR